MIWRRRRAPRCPEAALWDHLDACEIPFRAPLSDWIDRYHLSPSVWSEGLDYCIPDDVAPFFPGLDAPLHAQVYEVADLAAPPDYLWCALRGDGDHRLNYAGALARLTKIFGKGAETSSSNTVSREWRFGLARLSCTVWPPEKQSYGQNDRHRLFPDTITEASVAIHPAWRAPLSAEEHAACAAAKPIWADPSPTPGANIIRFSRDWPSDAATLPPGLALAGQDMLLSIRSPDIADLFPRTLMRELHLVRLTPARGGSMASLSLRLSAQLRDGPGEINRTVASVSGDHAALDAVAETLAKALDLPLDTCTGPSD
ncbi:hypothetical protein C8N43_0048 [Litoreibacter ponti]|uniref:Uncharacterized protein n=1 Tax=Litoreibacter ponti TaxID=1510457 RepID=A0A2T6BH80_9RHOB|nr:hypothetical protein [Litoreibacter ponti]PTX55414.1 hypothetical protein C8N43_0048 [Litoreibacter ponti]